MSAVSDNCCSFTVTIPKTSRQVPTRSCHSFCSHIFVYNRAEIGKKTTTEVFQLFHNFKEQVHPFVKPLLCFLSTYSLLQVKSCGAVTKANAAKDGAATRSQSAPAAAGTGKKIAGHSGGDGDPMVFNSVLVFYFTADCALGETHRRYQSGKDGRCQVTIIQDSRICTSMHTYSSDVAFPVHFSVVELSPNKSSFRASRFYCFGYSENFLNFQVKGVDYYRNC